MENFGDLRESRGASEGGNRKRERKKDRKPRVEFWMRDKRPGRQVERRGW